MITTTRVNHLCQSGGGNFSIAAFTAAFVVVDVFAELAAVLDAAFAAWVLNAESFPETVLQNLQLKAASTEAAWEIQVTDWSSNHIRLTNKSCAYGSAAKQQKC